jgi:hypothetical protein
VQFTAALVAGIVLLQRAATLPPRELAAAAFFVVLTLTGVGGIFERARWARPLETSRLLALGASCVGLLLVAPAMGPVAGAVLGLVAVSLLVLWRYRHALTELALAPVM